MDGKCLYVGTKKLIQCVGLSHDLSNDVASLVEGWSNAGGERRALKMKELRPVAMA